VIGGVATIRLNHVLNVVKEQVIIGHGVRMTVTQKDIPVVKVVKQSLDEEEERPEWDWLKRR
jgi:hypothetical protein